MEPTDTATTESAPNVEPVAPPATTATVTPTPATLTKGRHDLRRLGLELVPVAILLAAALPAVANEDLVTAAGSLGSMVAWCLLPSLLLLHFLVRSEWRHLAGVVLLIGLVVSLLRMGVIEEPLGGLILLQLTVWAPVLAAAVVMVDAVFVWVSKLGARSVPS